MGQGRVEGRVQEGDDGGSSVGRCEKTGEGGEKEGESEDGGEGGRERVGELSFTRVGERETLNQ